MCAPAPPQRGGRPCSSLSPAPLPSKALTFASPLIALLITVLIGVGLFMALGKDPVAGPAHVLHGSRSRAPYALSELSLKATPLLLIGLGLAVCFRANLWNIGAEGQFVMGAVLGGRCGAAWPTPDHRAVDVVPAILLAGVLGGMAWAGLAAGSARQVQCQ